MSSSTNILNWLNLDEDGMPPALHPDLKDCVVEMGGGMRFIKHPLVNAVYSETMHGHFNHLYAEKQKMLEGYEAEGNWSAVLFVVIERPWRVQYFCNYSHLMNDEEYWDLLSNIWSDSENNSQNTDIWEDLLNSDRPGREHFMDEAERKAFAALPDVLVIYRGTQGTYGDGAGFSWTLDKEKAIWFATRLDAGAPILLQGTAQKSDAVGYLVGRGESEIVIDPAFVDYEEIDF